MHVQNKVMDMFSIKSCKGVTIKNVNRILATRMYVRIYPAFLPYSHTVEWQIR
ncbi:MAG: hypothetical protein JWQ30_2642 [Sediminibacterium sp.]|nr:hypothetical protein [Sediminibacterium sp.]